MKFPATTPTPSQPPLSPHHCGPPLSHALMTSCRVTQGHRSPNWSGLKITPTKIQGIIFNLEHFKDMVYGCDAMTSFSDTAGVVEAERMGWKQEGRGRKSSSQYHCHTQWNDAIWQTLQIWSLLQFPLAFLLGCYYYWSLEYLRHDAREMKHFSCYVWQVTVQEDKEWLNHSDFMGETGGKGCYKSQKDSNQYSTDPHYKEVSNPSEYVNNLNCAHLAERLEQIVQDLWEKESTLCFWTVLISLYVIMLLCFNAELWISLSTLNSLLRYTVVYLWYITCHL